MGPPTGCPEFVVLTASADVLPVRELAVGSAAINTLWQIGSFLSPNTLGVAKDATGDFCAVLIGASILGVGQAD